MMLGCMFGAGVDYSLFCLWVAGMVKGEPFDAVVELAKERDKTASLCDLSHV